MADPIPIPFGLSRERRPVVVRGWPNFLGAERALSVAVGAQSLTLNLPDDAFVGMRFRSLGPAPGSPSAAVCWGEVPEHCNWGLVPGVAGSRLGGDGFYWNEARTVLTLQQSLREKRGLAYGALIDGAMTWHLERIIQAGGLLLHAACFGMDDAAVVVAGQSQAGKSTLCVRLGESFLSEEYAFLVPDRDRWQLWWFGERRAPASERRSVWPLRALHVLGSTRTETRTKPMATAEAVAALWPCVLVPSGLQSVALSNLVSLVGAVPTHLLFHHLETPVADVASTLLRRSL